MYLVLIDIRYKEWFLQRESNEYTVCNVVIIVNAYNKLPGSINDLNIGMCFTIQQRIIKQNCNKASNVTFMQICLLYVQFETSFC